MLITYQRWIESTSMNVLFLKPSADSLRGFFMYLPKTKLITIRFFGIIVFLFFGCIASSYAQTIIWLENFQGLADGTIVDNGATAWSRDVTACDFSDAGGGNFEVQSSSFEVTDTDGEGIWYSEWIDISSYSDVKVSVELAATGAFMGTDDYIRAYYSLDDGTETLLFNGDQSGQFGTATAQAGSFNGDSIQVIVRVNNSSFLFFGFWIPATNTFDNITVFEGVDTRYAIQPGGDWNDPATWSYTSGGATCTCIPDVFSEVHINEADDGQYVALNVDADARNVIIYDQGLLEWTSNNRELQINLNGGIYVQSGGELDGTRNQAKIEFVSDGSGNIIDNEGTFTINDIELENEGGSVTTTGAGNITIEDELRFIDVNTTFTNNSTGTLLISDDLYYDSDSSSFVNNGTVSISDDIRLGFGDDDNTITNNAGDVFNFGDDVNAGSSRLVINNYGTIDQDGRFSNVQAGEVQIYNRAGATWNYAGGINDDNDLQLYCNYDANVFNYDLAGDQEVHVPQDAYWSLTLSSSGLKTSLGNLDINGNLTISGTATLDVSVNSDDINLAGNWSNSGTFTEGTQTVTFDGSGSQSISNATGETFYNTVVNNSGTGLALSNGNITVSNALTMTQGNINVSTYTLTLGTGTGNPGSLSHTAGTIISKFERWVNSTGVDVLFPIGTSSNENFAVLNFANLTGGSLIGEFNPTDPGAAGLPLSETGYTVADQFTDGFWDFTAANGMASTGYDIDLDANGFTSYTISPTSRVIKRTNGGSWIFDGTHADAVSPTVYRTNLTGGISTTSTQFGIGQGCISIVIDKAITDVTCNGGSDRAIDITVSGGTPGYSYSWSHGPTSEDVTGLTAGDFTITVTDAGSCSQDSTFTVIEPVVLNATVNSTGVTCTGGNDGSITISSPTGGSGSYDYTINGGTSWQGSGTFTTLSAGTYDVRIRDALETTCVVTLDGALVLTEPNDIIPPTFTAPANITIYSDASCAYDASVGVTGDVTDEADNCSVGDATYSDAVNSADPCNIIITRTWSLVDDNSNAAADQDQTITVQDNLSPTFTGSITTTTVEGCSTGDAPSAETTVAGLEGLTGDLLISDNCSADGDMSVSSSDVAVGTCPIVITRTYTVSDECGNVSANITHTINVQETIAPTFSIPTDITLYSDASCVYDAGVGVTGDVTDESDNCSVGLNATYVDGVDNSDPCNIIITRIWSLVDGCGNTASDQIQTIIVQDTIAPTAICRDTTLQLDESGNATITASDIDNGSSDNCSIGSMLLDNYSFNCADIGSNVITLTVTDQCGFQSTCISTVTIEDIINPIVTCPGDRLITAAAGKCSIVVNGIAPVFAGDNCSANQVTYRLEGATTGTGSIDASG